MILPLAYYMHNVSYTITVLREGESVGLDHYGILNLLVTCINDKTTLTLTKRVGYIFRFMAWNVLLGDLWNLNLKQFNHSAFGDAPRMIQVQRLWLGKCNKMTSVWN